MKKWLIHVFTWWNGATLNTRFYTSRHGERVGEDEFGNVYYRSRGGAIDPAFGHDRRWVIYNGVSEASTVPPGWNGWLHHTVDVAPVGETYAAHAWEKPHLANLTGTPQAYRPPGSILRDGERAPATGDYKAWSPSS